MTSKSVSRVKEMVENSVGQKVKFKVRKGKNRSQMSEGIIAETYPAIFTVHVQNKDFKRVISFNYIDVLTNYVEVFLCDEKETRIV
nr:Veg family protein [Sedimentibacter sp.]